MAALPSPTQVAGTHCAIYEAYYHQVDPNGSGAVQALDAARFLKKSRLSDVVLSKIWDLSDPSGKGYLDKAGLFVALKLVALAQAGKDINMSNIHSEAPPPKVGELPKVPPGAAPARPAAPSPLPPAAVMAPLSDWSVKPAERDKYSQLFDSLQPNNGLIAGNKVKGVLMESKLPLDTLGKIWDLADQDKDGMLDRHEFMVAMHLVYKALEKHAVPTSLPPELGRPRPARPPSRPPSPHARPPRPTPPPQTNANLLDGLLDFSSPPSSTPVMSHSPLPFSAPSAPAPSGWVVTATEAAQYAAQFAAADQDRDGYVSGAEIKHTFLETGLPQHTLAHIWALCDTQGLGKLSRNQFALAMWLVARALRGEQPPPALAHNMLPPPDAPIPEPAPTLGPQPTPEMEAIAREIDALARERVALEAEIAAKERDNNAGASEADGLQSELDTLTATLKQLENQKGEAQKRLNDLKTQVEKLRSQVSAQEAAAAETEAEVAARRAAQLSLKEKEVALQREARDLAAQAEELTQRHSARVLQLSQANIKISHLEEQLRLMNEAVAALESGSGYNTQIQPQFTQEHLDKLVRGATPNDALEDESFAQSNGFSNGGGGFESDPFKDYSGKHDPFAPSGNPPPAQSGFGGDPFAPSADPFAGDTFTNHDNHAKDDGAWESDPFAVLHAPTRASVAAGGHAGAGGGAGAGGPALPPKSHKTPPPRPAPPRPNPPHKSQRAAMEFTDDPFKDYRYEDPFNIEDPFADVTDSKRADPFGRPTSVPGFETDDFFDASSAVNGSFTLPEKRSGRVSAPPVAYDPFASRSDRPKPLAAPTAPSAPVARSLHDVSSNNNDSWSAWPNDNWASDDAWSKPAPVKDTWSNSTKNNTSAGTNDWKTDNWANKTENWAADWNSDTNKNLNETWPSNTLPSKKEKSPKPVKYARSLVHTIGGIGRTKQKNKKDKAAQLEARSSETIPTEEQQWAWAAAESKRLEKEAEKRRMQEDAELQLALAISRQEK